MDESAILEFQRWAVSCAGVLYRSGKISESEWDEMKKATAEGKPLDWNYLRKTFKRAAKNVDELGGLTLGNVRKYFTEGHNALVAGDSATWEVREACMSHRGKVVALENGKGIVEYRADKLLPEEHQGIKRREVSFAYLSGVKIGDEVWIHWKDAIGFVTK